MNATCDRCGPAVRAVSRASRGAELYLCGHCTNQLRPALSAQGWAIAPVAGGLRPGGARSPAAVNPVPSGRPSSDRAGLWS